MLSPEVKTQANVCSFSRRIRWHCQKYSFPSRHYYENFNLIAKDFDLCIIFVMLVFRTLFSVKYQKFPIFASLPSILLFRSNFSPRGISSRKKKMATTHVNFRHIFSFLWLLQLEKY